MHNTYLFFDVIILLMYFSINFSGNNAGDHDETDRLSVSKVFLKKSLISTLVLDDFTLNIKT